MISRRGFNALLAGILLFSAWIHLTHLQWGLPSSKRTLSVFGSGEEFQRWVPKMIEQRNKYYSMVGELLNENRELKGAHQNLSNRWDTPLFEPISQEIVLDRVRNYAVGVTVSDDQVTLSAISGMNPKKLDFVPGPLAYYGVLYYYTAAAFLAAGKVLGLITLNPGVEYYFNHPDEVRRMYMLLRALGGVSVILSVLILARAAAKFYGPSLGLFSAAALATSPVLVPVSHLAKAHIFGMLWITLAAYFACKILKSENPSQGLGKEFAAMAVFLGFSVGSIFTNLVAGSLIFFTEWAAQDWKLSRTLKSARFWKSCALFLIVSAAANFHLLLNWSEFRRYVQSNAIFYPEFLQAQVRQWPTYIKDVLSEQISVLMGPLFAAGIYFSFKRKERFMQVCFLTFLVLFAQNLVSTRHAPINTRFLPFFALLSGWGILELWRSVGDGFSKLILGLGIGAALSVSAVQCAYYRHLHRSPTRLDLAGEWMNQNLPKGASIGAWGKGFSPFDFPPIRFLDYKMIAIPHPHELDASNPRIGKMPQFLVLSAGYTHGLARYPQSVFLAEHYKTLQEWKDPAPLWERLFGSVWLRTGNWSLKVLEKK